MTLRWKITLTLVLTSVFAAATVGGVAEWLLRRDFESSLFQNSFQDLQHDLIDYVDHYGSLEKGIKQESLQSFQLHRNRLHSSRRSAEAERTPEREARFLLIRGDASVIFPVPGFSSGQSVNRAFLEKSLPVRRGEEVIAYAYALKKPDLTVEDAAYLWTIRKTLLSGVAVASLISLGIGFLLGQNLSRALRRLIRSISVFGSIIENRDADLDLHLCRVPEKYTINPSDEIGVLALTFNVMIDRLSIAYRKLRDEGIRDPLTGLFNRRYFDEQAALLFDVARRHNHSLCVVLADIDYFKKINDRFSHGVGDDVLKRVAGIMHRNIRSSDILARYGGEEFILILTECNLEEALVLAERIRSSIDHYPWREVKMGLGVTLSLGLSIFASHSSVGKMIEEADRYLYVAKEKGRNRVEYPGRRSEAGKSLYRRIRDWL